MKKGLKLYVWNDGFSSVVVALAESKASAIKQIIKDNNWMESDDLLFDAEPEVYEDKFSLVMFKD